MNPASVTAVIPVRNGEATIGRCLASLFAQTAPAAQIVLVDDGSTDGTLNVAERFADRIQIVRSPERLHVARARNAGLRAARGDILFFIDADCYAHPDWIETGLRDFREGVVGIRGRTIYDDPHPGPCDRFVSTGERSTSFNTCNIAYRRAALSDLGGFDERFWCGREDTDLAFRALGIGEIRYRPDMLVFHQKRAWTWRQILDDAPRDRIEVLFLKSYLLDRERTLNDRQRRALAAYREDSLWGRVLYPKKLLAALFPPLLLLYHPIRSLKDVACLPLCWLYYVLKRLMYWYGAVRYRVAVI